MKMHICIRNNDHTHYHIYANAYDVCMQDNLDDNNNKREYLELNMTKEDFATVNVKIQRPDDLLRHKEYTREFKENFTRSYGYTLCIDWRKAGHKININGFNVL